MANGWKWVTCIDRSTIKKALQRQIYALSALHPKRTSDYFCHDLFLFFWWVALFWSLRYRFVGMKAMQVKIKFNTPLSWWQMCRTMLSNGQCPYSNILCVTEHSQSEDQQRPSRLTQAPHQSSCKCNTKSVINQQTDGWKRLSFYVFALAQKKVRTFRDWWSCFPIHRHVTYEYEFWQRSERLSH